MFIYLERSIARCLEIQGEQPLDAGHRLEIEQYEGTIIGEGKAKSKPLKPLSCVFRAHVRYDSIHLCRLMIGRS